MSDKAPIVFLSYSHDSETHAARVKQLSDHLRSEGVDAIIDQDEVSPAEGWPMWMDRWLRKADFVLIICTEIYQRRANGDENITKGHGVRWESTLAYNHIYDGASENQKFIPVVFDEENKTHIPTPLRGATNYLLDQEYPALYQRFFQIGIRRPPLGPRIPISDTEKVQKNSFSRSNIHHRIIMVTGLTSSGKDSLITDLYNDHLVRRDDFFFPTKVISRDPRPDEHLVATRGVRDFPYLVTRRERKELEHNEDGEFFSVYNRYGNYAGFMKKEVEYCLISDSSVKVIYIQPEVERIRNHKLELQDMCRAEFQARHHRVSVSTVLIEAPKDVCRSRLNRRGLPPPYRVLRAAGIDRDWEIVQTLKSESFFDSIVNNSNSTAFDQAKQQLLDFLLKDGS
jgi:guanylate kinase